MAHIDRTPSFANIFNNVSVLGKCVCVCACVCVCVCQPQHSPPLSTKTYSFGNKQKYRYVTVAGVDEDRRSW